jgi:superfamily II DNA or RNA helicase
MTIRNRRQEEFADVWMTSKRFGILYLCPRFGKIRTSINILESFKPKLKRVLIAYPDNKIKDSWQADFADRGYLDANVTYTTHLSLKKYSDKKFDLVIIDEIHLLSEAQIEVCKDLFDNNKQVLGLTGTLASDTERTLKEELDIDVILQQYKTSNKTEKQQFKAISYVINKMMYSGGNSMFMRLARMRIIQNSISKVHMTKQLLNNYKDDRILVFCGTTKVADELGIPSYHSKSKDKESFQKFAEGEGNHMAVVKIGNTGVTYKPLNKVIINYFDSNAENLAQKINRCMAMEYNTPDKKAAIYIISTDEKVEEKWLAKALQFFDKNKIKYI